MIAERPRPPVAEITQTVPGVSSVSCFHNILRCCENRGLVRSELKGASNVYYIDPHGLGQMRAWLDRFWSKTLTAYRFAVEQTTEESS